MRIQIEDAAGTCCAHQIWVDLDDGRGWQLLQVVLSCLLRKIDQLTDAPQDPADPNPLARAN